MAKILITGDPDDAHIRHVKKSLVQCGCQVEVWPPRFLLYEQELRWRLDRDTATLAQNNNKFNIYEFDGIWLRRLPTVKPLPAPESWIESFCQRESSKALGSLLRTYKGFSVNSIAAQQECSYKLNQLKTAQLAGFNVPETLITNCRDEVENFFNECQGRLIYKLIDEASGTLLPTTHNPSGIYTRLTTASDLEEFTSVNRSIHLFQREVQKKFDVRLTVIGNEIFGAAIMSQSGSGKVDFRMDYSVPLEKFDITPAIQNATLSLMSRMGLVFGCVDLAVDNKGVPFFFELNAQGQFLWIEDALGFPLSERLARLLRTGTK